MTLYPSVRGLEKKVFPNHPHRSNNTASFFVAGPSQGFAEFYNHLMAMKTARTIAKTVMATNAKTKLLSTIE